LEAKTGSARRAWAAPNRGTRTVAQNSTAQVLVDAPAGGEAVGLKADVSDHLLFVAGGTTGATHVYNSRTGALVAHYQFAPNGAALINDMVLTAHAAYFTDSYNPDLYKIPIGPGGRLGRGATIPLSGPAAAFFPTGLYLNGIAATAGGATLIVNNTVLDDDPTTLAKFGDRLALPNGRYDLGIPPGPSAPGRRVVPLLRRARRAQGTTLVR
jgi:hypothetical protein